MLKTIIFVFFCIPFFTEAQTDVLILKKRGMHVYSYTIGSPMMIKTIYDQWLQGTITDMRNDTIFLNDQPFYYKEIAGIRRPVLSLGNTLLPSLMMVIGAGTFVLGGVNGLLRHDQSKDWYTTSGIISGSALLVVGYLLTKTWAKTYRIGKKFTLDYLIIGRGSSPKTNQPR
ncbi:MAG TPA: hypothetical protein VNS58_24995 [Puia sp.]|nr:hypothetical protein [Puia sp.]